jgi:hypothetical protein
MTDNPYIFFNKTLDECRQLGARGGRAQARNRRLCQLERSLEPEIALAPEPVQETAAEAIAALDAQFPWLSGAEKRKQSRRASGAMISPPSCADAATDCCAASH